jgi:uncharacterized protein (TIGR03435 family)
MIMTMMQSSACAILLTMSLPCAGFDQSPNARPAFEVASVKRSPPPDPARGMIVRATGGPGTNDPGIFRSENFDLGGLVAMAYGIRSYQLSGPPWISDGRFEVMAKVPDGATKEQFRLMLQDLLGQRFKLVVRSERKEMPVYELKVRKNGPRMTESTVLPPGQPPPDVPSDRSIDGDGSPILPPGSFPGGPPGIITRAGEWPTYRWKSSHMICPFC